MTHYGPGWRVRVEYHHNFALDQLNVWIGQRNDLGEISMVEEAHLTPGVAPGMVITMSEPIMNYGEPTAPTVTISRELAEALFEALTPVMIGTDSANILEKVRELRRERDEANARFNKLLDAMSRTGPATASATAPRGSHPKGTT